MREGLNRLWLVLILAAFGLPLFIGLGSTDLANDEAIYSYAVESILTTGDWLSPRSSPNEDVIFIEKPPLKFWIVAAPIHFGLLPYNEFGLRFWDPVFGMLAFLYVFLIGHRLAGPICGVVSVLVLFAHEPLIFNHGLRSNNMDAALMLAYCGGVYHYLRWSSGGPARRWHIAAVAGWFSLGFMTKFVAVLFLPAILGATALALSAQRRQFAQDWWGWVLAGAAVLACAFPWFYYQHSLHGSTLWRVMFGEHVYTRFTQFADPNHLRPWHFYLSEAHTELVAAGSAFWVALGLAVLLVQTIRHHTTERVIIFLWLMLPMTLLSLGSSKLYHYFYPYLPPLALAAGAGVAWVADAAGKRLGPNAWLDWRTSDGLRTVAGAVSVVVLGLALATAINGGVRFSIGEHLLFRNTSIARPLLIAVFGIALAAGIRSGAAIAIVLLLSVLVPTPLTAYTRNLKRLNVTNRPLGGLAECLREVEADRGGGGQPSGVYAPVPEDAFLHPYFYYLRGTGWHARRADDEQLHSALRVDGQERPVVLDHARYVEFVRRTGQVPRTRTEVRLARVVVLLPGPYAVCAARRSGGR